MSINCPECNRPIEKHPAMRCLDVWVAMEVMGAHWVELSGRILLESVDHSDLAEKWSKSGSVDFRHLPAYSVKLTDAWNVICKICETERVSYEVIRHEDGSFFFVIQKGIPDGAGQCEWIANGLGSTLPLAVCRASIKLAIEGIWIRQGE